jgi:hypothetical protein
MKNCVEKVSNPFTAEKTLGAGDAPLAAAMPLRADT